MMADRFIFYFTKVAFEPSMIFQNAVTALCAVLLLAAVPRSRSRAGILALHVSVVYIALTLLNGLIDGLAGRASVMLYVSHAIVLTLYAVFFCDYKISARVILCCVFYSAEMCLNNVAGTVPKLFENVPYGGTVEIGIRTFAVALTVLIPLFLRRFDIDKLPVIGGGSVALIVGFDLFSTVAALFYSLETAQFAFESRLFALIVFLGFIVTNLLAYYMIYYISRGNNANLELLADKYMNDNNREMMRINAQNLEDMRRIRHDIKNQYASMKVMLAEKQYDELAKFFESWEESIFVPVSYVDYGNGNISAVLNIEKAKARAAGLELNAKVFVSPELPFSDSEICSLLTNLIDNAIEGTKRCGEGVTSPIIDVGLRQMQDNYLYITVANPVADADKSKLLSGTTSKANPLLHGYGTKIVGAIVRRYGGEINRDVIEGRYVVDVMLDLMWDNGG